MPLWGEAVINDGPGLMLIVQKFRGANTMEVTRGVEAADRRDAARACPAWRSTRRSSGRRRSSSSRSTTSRSALLIGVLLVILIIAAFLFEWRTAFISLIAIPLSLLAAILVLDLRGTTINVMVLAGLVVAIGVVVDDAIIDVENIVRRLRQARAEGREVSTFRVVLDASVEVRSAITYATIINVVAIVPVFFLQGLSGSFFQPLVLSYGLAVLVSMLVALTVTPALCLLLLSRGRLVPPRVAAAARAQARLRRGPRACSCAGRARRSPRRPRCSSPALLDLPDARLAAPAELQGARLPHALADRAVDVGAGGEAHLDPRLPRPARDPRRAQLRLAHRPGAAVRRGLRRLLRRELDQRRRGRRLRQDARRRAPHGRGLPGPLPRRADLPARAHQGGPDRHERVDRRAHLRPRPRRPARQGGRDRRADRRRSRASSTPTRTSPRTCRTSRSRSTSPRRGATGSSRATSAASPRRCSPARRSATSSTAARPTTCTCGASRRRATASTDVERLPIDTPGGGQVRLERGGRRADRADAEPHRARAAVAPDRRRRERRGTRPRRRSSTTSRSASRASTSRPSTTPRCSASRPSSTPPRTACCSSA